MMMVLCTALRVAAFQVLLISSYQAIKQSPRRDPILPEGTVLHLMQALFNRPSQTVSVQLS
jgi:hypothetical protein